MGWGKKGTIWTFGPWMVNTPLLGLNDGVIYIYMLVSVLSLESWFITTFRK